MLKRILSAMLAMLFVGMLFLAGCEKDEIKTHRHTEVPDQPVGEPEEVVE